MRALVQHHKWCRANGVRVPAELVALLDELASAGQRRPTVAPHAADPQHELVLALDHATAGHRLGVSDRTVRRMVAAGHLPAVDVAGCKRIRATDLAHYVEAL